LVGLILYMMAYSEGLKQNNMGPLVRSLGFCVNWQCNIAMRWLLTCGGCKNDSFLNFVMNREAGERLQAQQRPRLPLASLEFTANEHFVDGAVHEGMCFIGDSEFTFWHHLARDMLDFSPDCFNAGFGGCRTADLVNHLAPLCLQWNPKAVVLHAGGNDLDFDPDVSPQNVAERLMTLFEALVNHKSISHIGYMLSSRRPVYSDVKWEYMKAVHSATQAELVRRGLWSAVTVFDLRGMVHPIDEFQLDRSHLNAKGHYRKAQVLKQKMFELWPSFSCNAKA